MNPGLISVKMFIFPGRLGCPPMPSLHSGDSHHLSAGGLCPRHVSTHISLPPPGSCSGRLVCHSGESCGSKEDARSYLCLFKFCLTIIDFLWVIWWILSIKTFCRSLHFSYDLSLISPPPLSFSPPLSLYLQPLTRLGTLAVGWILLGLLVQLWSL